MSTTQLNDIVEPAIFTDYITQNTMQKSALVQSGVMTKNSVIAQQITAGAHSFTVPMWLDLGNEEADIVSDDPDEYSTPSKIGTTKQVVRKSYLAKSWSAMNLASEIAGSDALARIQDRTTAYWERQLQSRLIASLNGILADNIATNAGDMVLDISEQTGEKNKFSPSAVIDAAGTMGDAMNGTDGVTGIAVHGDIYRAALKADMIEFIPSSDGSFNLATYRGLVITVDDGLPLNAGKYTSILFGRGAVGYAVSAPRIAAGTAIETKEAAGNGGGQQILHSRLNIGLAPAGFSFLDHTVLGESPSLAELAIATNWKRVTERKATPLAFLISKI